ASAYPGPFVASAVGATSLLLATGGGGRWLPRLVTGEWLATVAGEEDGAPGCWSAQTTRARGGAVTGRKIAVAQGLRADCYLVLARDESGVGVYAVPRDAVGLAVVPEPGPDPSRPTVSLVLDAAPGERTGPGDHSAAAGRSCDRVLAAWCADGVGAAQAAFDLACAHARTRTQFGVPVGSFQAVQHLLVDAFGWLVSAREGVREALACDSGDDPALAHRAAVMAKAWAGEQLPRVGATAIQVLGGIGFTWEHEVGILYKRLLGLQTTHGTVADSLAAFADLEWGELLSRA
ncbi:MAG: acyl-CoA dehydrogenase family protein, partial [Mycobacteriales bacterium]